MKKTNKESERLLIIRRIEEICKRMDEIDVTIKKDGEAWSLYNWGKSHSMPSPDGEEDNLSVDVYDSFKDRHNGLEEEKKQLFEVYQLCLKELRRLEQEK